MWHLIRVALNQKGNNSKFLSAAPLLIVGHSKVIKTIRIQVNIQHMQLGVIIHYNPAVSPVS